MNINDLGAMSVSSVVHQYTFPLIQMDNIVSELLSASCFVGDLIAHIPIYVPFTSI